MARIKKCNLQFALNLRFLSFYLFQFLSLLTSKQLSISSCHSERNQDNEDIVNKTRVMKAAKCKILQPNPAHHSVSACPTLKESKWSKWRNSTFINNWTLVMLFVLFHNYYILHILTLRLLMSYIYIYIYIYGAPILDVSRSHTTTQHSR